jgi:hypothetical protein
MLSLSLSVSLFLSLSVCQILHCTSTVADCEHLWPELLRGGLVRAFSCAISSSVLTAQLQVEALRRGGGAGDTTAQQQQQQQGGEEGEEEDEASPPLPVLVKEAGLEAPAVAPSPPPRQQQQQGGSAGDASSSSGSGHLLPFQLQVGHICIALRHLSHTLQAAEQVLRAAPLEVLLCLSASDAMAALHQVLRMLSSSSSSSEPATDALQQLAASVRRNLRAATEPPSPPPPSPSGSQALLALSQPPAALLARLDPPSSAHMLAALLLPVRGLCPEKQEAGEGQEQEQGQGQEARGGGRGGAAPVRAPRSRVPRLQRGAGWAGGRRPAVAAGPAGLGGRAEGGGGLLPVRAALRQGPAEWRGARVTLSLIMCAVFLFARVAFIYLLLYANHFFLLVVCFAAIARALRS